ncbi:hypothetical protein LCGC14_1974030 [marine sediment metagenome]|uniref:Uncharacterized protein n=1 Tax=marine sediment metagenome TaxID=412755 RepID=A0A0F9FZ24_9ZZZZ
MALIIDGEKESEMDLTSVWFWIGMAIGVSIGLLILGVIQSKGE